MMSTASRRWRRRVSSRPRLRRGSRGQWRRQGKQTSVGNREGRAAGGRLSTSRCARCGRFCVGGKWLRRVRMGKGQARDGGTAQQVVSHVGAFGGRRRTRGVLSGYQLSAHASGPMIEWMGPRDLGALNCRQSVSGRVG